MGYQLSSSNEDIFSNTQGFDANFGGLNKSSDKSLYVVAGLSIISLLVVVLITKGKR